MARGYECGIATNWDAWFAVRDGIEDGLSLLEISGRTGISYRMVGVYRDQSRPASIMRRINCNHQGAFRCACGAPLSASAAQKPNRCERCERARLRAEAGTDERIALLRSSALYNGRVPTTNEARDLLGIARSYAGDLVREAFGADTRRGAQLRMSYRGYPEGAPDVPRPDQIAALGRRRPVLEIEFAR